MSDKLNFPKDFYWGAATSSHQVEGNNHNNWTEWEIKNSKIKSQNAKLRNWPDFILRNYPNPLQEENYISGRACDHYNRFREDFDIAKQLGHNAHRFSIEWSRIEPEEGKFDEKEIEHYRQVILALKERGIEPFVTLWHWTNSLWVANFGGPESKKFPIYFTRYIKFIVRNFKDLVRFWITLNEPTSVIGAAYTKGIWPPQKKNPFAALRVYKNLAHAHNLAFDAIHEISPQAKVGFANVLNFLEPFNKNSILDNFAVKIGEYFSNKKFLNLTEGRHDFLTLQYYFHKRIKFPAQDRNENKEVSNMGWEIYPEGIYHLLKDLKKYNKPIYITENGIADIKDEKRVRFIKEHLKWVHKAISEGVNVRGYFYWSLLDNFEWDKGFWPRFGLIEVDYKTMERKIRNSAWEYKKIIENGLES